jgi:hypothetical protein
MAYITPVNGDAQPVFALDVQNGPIAASTSTAATPVQPAGPKLDFFRVVANTSVATQQGVQEYVANVIQAIQQTATIAMYQVDGTVLSFATFPTGAFANAATNTSAAVFLAAANVTYTGYQLDTCTSIGFKLAAS